MRGRIAVMERVAQKQQNLCLGPKLDGLSVQYMAFTRDAAPAIVQTVEDGKAVKLDEYRKKRDFSATPEPRGAGSPEKNGNGSFIYLSGGSWSGIPTLGAATTRHFSGFALVCVGYRW
jgi:hypothetical protein